jgi:sugar O-acyltransferase (sialic acid O-acetyltransferase NeuD family)
MRNPNPAHHPALAHPHSNAPVHPPLVLLGGGGHSLVVSMVAKLHGWRIAGYFDDAPNAVLSQGKNAPAYLGTMKDVKRVCERDPVLGTGLLADENPACIVAFGEISQRERALNQLQEQRCSLPFANLWWTDAALLDLAQVQLGEGVLLALHSIVQPRATIGDHAIINTGAIVEHECVIGRNSHIAPGCVLGGRVTVGDNTLVGLGSRVLPGVKIGSQCVIGAGAVVVRDVPDGSTVVGVPAHAPRSGILHSLVTQNS